jgi:hypothetical protein
MEITEVESFPMAIPLVASAADGYLSGRSTTLERVLTVGLALTILYPNIRSCSTGSR